MRVVYKPANVRVDLIPTHDSGESKELSESLDPYSGNELDCFTIWTAYGEEPEVYGPFSKGIAVIRSCNPLEVVAVQPLASLVLSVGLDRS